METSSLSKPNQLYNIPTSFSYNVPYKSISTNRYTDTNETFRSERSEGDITSKMSQDRVDADDVVHGIKHSLLYNDLREDGGLGDIKLQPCKL